MSFGDKSMVQLQGDKTPLTVTMTVSEAAALQTLVYAATQIKLDQHMAVGVGLAGGDAKGFILDLYQGWGNLTRAGLKACGDGSEIDRELGLQNGLLQARLDQERADHEEKAA